MGLIWVLDTLNPNPQVYEGLRLQKHNLKLRLQKHKLQERHMKTSIVNGMGTAQFKVEDLGWTRDGHCVYKGGFWALYCKPHFCRGEVWYI